MARIAEGKRAHVLDATAIIVLCAGLLLAWTVVQQFRARRWYSLAAFVLGLAAYLGLLRALFGFPGAELADPKGEGDGFLPQVLAMFVCMLAGMAAEYQYQRFDKPAAERRSFDVGEFVKPFLVSPLVFMPLAASLHGANVDLARFDAPRLMVFLVAFENGYLWRATSAASSRVPRRSPQVGSHEGVLVPGRAFPGRFRPRGTPPGSQRQGGGAGSHAV